MPIRRINYTGRRRIKRSDIDVVLITSECGAFSFDVALRLANYKFPEDARIALEAYRQTSLMRFDCGSIANQTLPNSRALSEFDSSEHVLFRVRVTAVGEREGVLLGEAEGIRPTDAQEVPDKRTPLLPPVPGDIGEEVWRVEFDGPPILRVNSGLKDWKEVVRSNTFRALVFPAALRSVLQQILLVDDSTDTEDSSDWRALWLRFALSLPGVGPIPEESYGDWIDDVAAAFARKFAMRSAYDKSLVE